MSSCFPSKTDTFGLVLLEAMACGLPVAAYPVTGPRDVIGDSKAGVLHEDLRTACLEALKLRREDALARARLFTWRAATEQFFGNLHPRKRAAGAPLSPDACRLIPQYKQSVAAARTELVPRTGRWRHDVVSCVLSCRCTQALSLYSAGRGAEPPLHLDQQEENTAGHGTTATPGELRMSTDHRRGGVSYKQVGADYFANRGLKRYAKVWSLWALGVGAVISGHYSGWNFGLANGFGLDAGGAVHHRRDVLGPDLQSRRDVAGACRTPARRIPSRAARWDRGAECSRDSRRASSTS